MAGNFGNALQAFFLGVGEADLAVALVPVKNALTAIVKNPSAQNIVAQGAVLSIALPATLPNIEQTTAGALAAEGLALLESYVPTPAGS